MPEKNNGEIVLYQPDDSISIEVRINQDTVWLNRQQLAMLFDRDVKTIGKHINNALKEELSDVATIAKFATVQVEGSRIVNRTMEYYNLDMVLSVGYRVKSDRGINVQYALISVVQFNKAHDRFLLIDDDVYHIGASIKDLGKKWFAFTLMRDITAKELIGKMAQ